MTEALTLLAGAFGLLVGSFLNVVVHRVPRGASVVKPRSACPACGAVIRPRDNVPVLSWLLLRARCRDCGAPISARYPLVEGLTAVLFVGVVLRFSPERPWSIPAFCYLAAIGVALALIDLEHHRLPDAIVLPSYVVVAGLLVLASWGDGDWAALARAGIGGLALWVLYFGLMLVKPGGMGFGDVKLAGILGAALAWLGWGSLVVGAFGAFLLGGGFAAGMLLMRKAHRRTAIPFGPWMIAGAVLAVGIGEPVWSWYLGLLS